ncbi:MAG TPA: hypothetical protein VN673_14010 [Clostridia bacterium]|nr:hypothetical protein [Clostridia bacterium]
MNTYIFILQVGGLCLCLVQIFYFDRLARGIYSHQQEFWDGIGRPRGFFWAAPNTARWAHATWVATTRLWWSLLLHSPTWMRSDAHLYRQVWTFRAATLMLFLFFISWFIYGVQTGRLS